MVGESASFIPQYKLENAKLPRFMLLHFGRPRLIWDWIILILVAYIAIMVPFNVAFKTHDRTFEIIIADTVVEIFFVFDIVINFRTTYIDKKSGRIVTQQRQIAMHYIKGWFFIDLLAALPFEALYFFDHSWGFLVALLKTGRLLRLFRVARRISRYIEYTVSLLGLLMLSFALLGHWFACVWYVIGYDELLEGKHKGWLYSLGEQMGNPYVNMSVATGPSYVDAYVSSLYFILTSLTTVGFGNIAPNTVAEKIFSVVVLLLGAIMQSAIFGNMTAVIQKLYSARARFHAKATEIKQFIKLHHIDGDLKRRIEDYFLTNWSVSKGVDTNEILEAFPVELRADICLHMYANLITLPCFAGVNRGCSRALSLKIKRAYFGPGELILKEGDVINAIFFVNSGTIEIVQKDCIVAILGSGDLFGENIATKLPIRKSNGDVRALTYCDLLYLTRENFQEVLYFYPDFAEVFSQRLEMTFNLGIRERNLSTHNPLDCITEDDEEIDSETTDSEAAEEHTLIKNKDTAPLSPKLPLWQQQLRKMESEKNKDSTDNTQSLTLEERLMRIESDSSSNDSSSDTDLSSDSMRFSSRKITSDNCEGAPETTSLQSSGKANGRICTLSRQRSTHSEKRKSSQSEKRRSKTERKRSRNSVSRRSMASSTKSANSSFRSTTGDDSGEKVNSVAAPFKKLSIDSFIDILGKKAPDELGNVVVVDSTIETVHCPVDNRRMARNRRMGSICNHAGRQSQTVAPLDTGRTIEEEVDSSQKSCKIDVSASSFEADSSDDNIPSRHPSYDNSAPGTQSSNSNRNSSANEINAIFTNFVLANEPCVSMPDLSQPRKPGPESHCQFENGLKRSTSLYTAKEKCSRIRRNMASTSCRDPITDRTLDGSLKRFFRFGRSIPGEIDSGLPEKDYCSDTDKSRPPSDMFWDLYYTPLSPSFPDHMHEVHGCSSSGYEDNHKAVDLPGTRRPSSGVFSRASDMWEHDSVNKSQRKSVLAFVEPGSADSNSEPSDLRSSQRLPFHIKEWDNPSYPDLSSSNVDVKPAEEQKKMSDDIKRNSEAVKEIQNLLAKSSDSNALLQSSDIIKGLSDSREKMDSFSTRFDTLSSDVNSLQSDVRNLTNLVKRLLDQQSPV